MGIVRRIWITFTGIPVFYSIFTGIIVQSLYDLLFHTILVLLNEACSRFCAKWNRTVLSTSGISNAVELHTIRRDSLCLLKVFTAPFGEKFSPVFSRKWKVLYVKQVRSFIWVILFGKQKVHWTKWSRRFHWRQIILMVLFFYWTSVQTCNTIQFS